MTLVPAFHTDTDAEDPVYHDQLECPYGIEITRNGDDLPGTDNRRRRTWCIEASKLLSDGMTDITVSEVVTVPSPIPRYSNLIGNGGQE